MNTSFILLAKFSLEFVRRILINKIKIFRMVKKSIGNKSRRTYIANKKNTKTWIAKHVFAIERDLQIKIFTSLKSTQK